MRLWALASGCAVVLASTAQARQLEQELRDLVEAHPQIAVAQKRLLSSEEDIRAARSGFLPTVRLRGDAGYEHVDSPTIDGRDSDRQTSGIVVTQNLFDGFGTTSRVEGAQIGRGMAESNLQAARQNVILEGIAAYVEVLRQAALIGLARDNEDNVRSQLNLEDERVRRGSGVTVDVLQAKQRLQVAMERRVAVTGGFEAAVARYIQVFGVAPNIAAMFDPQPPVDLLPGSLDDAIELARSNNPAVIAGEENIRLSETRRTTAKAGYYPSVDLVGRANYERNKEGTQGVRRDQAVLVELNWELFSGFRTTAATRQAALDYAASRDAALDTNRRAEEQARIAWHAIETARERLDLLENAVNIANEVFESRRRQRETGNATLLEVLDAESAIYGARINYVTASYDLRLAVYHLLHAMGQLELDVIDRRARN